MTKKKVVHADWDFDVPWEETEGCQIKKWTYPDGESVVQLTMPPSVLKKIVDRFYRGVKERAEIEKEFLLNNEKVELLDGIYCKNSKTTLSLKWVLDFSKEFIEI